MGSRRKRDIRMPAPYLRRVWLDPSRVPDREAYPFCLPFLHDEFELSFDRPITIIAGENGAGKSTLLEGIAVLAGYDEAGGGKGYRPVDHSNASETMGGGLSEALRASWLPKITKGWFFRAESFFSVARQMEFLKLLRRMEQSTICQVVMATHSPVLMAYPGARLLWLSKYGLEPVAVEHTDHYKVMREFCNDPAGFVEAVVEE
jgi:predicted ATPase